MDDDPCRELEELCRAHCAEHGDDALCLFMKTHLCVCRSVIIGKASRPILELNAKFVEKFIEVYANYNRGRSRDIPKL